MELENRKNLIAGISAGVSIILLGSVMVTPNVYAADTTTETAVTVSSARKFPKQNIAIRRLTAEATTTDVTGDWGGIETLNVPETQSPAEQQAAAAAKQQADAQAAAQAQQQAELAAKPIEMPASKDAESLVKFALQFQGYPYVAGGNTPAGWDCSGFTQYVYTHFGINMPHSSYAQPSMGTLVSNPMPGDLMVGPGHAGIYIGNGMMIHAMNPVDGTKVTAVFPGMSFYRVL